ncbi:MAG: hypothetical protein GZ094_20185 [Mariniphaga sp.]|nr:hypothetical protein [Mariniphaga sp.]
MKCNVVRKIKTCFTAVFLFSASCCFAQNTGLGSQILPAKYFKSKFRETGVIFTSPDTVLKKLFDAAESKAIKNVHYFSPAYTVMVEGGEYPFVWLETQPMGGVMYAKRDINIALDNIRIFINNQRNDGLLAGMVYNTGNNVWNMHDPTAEDGTLGLHFDALQGLYLAQPALELYYLLNHDKEYLGAIYNALEKYDNYLWKYRDSDKDGCLETWGMTDNGEDHLERFRYAPWAWPGNIAPKLEKFANISDASDVGDCPVPEESMDLMGYSYSCRDVLAKISAITNNGKRDYWRDKANAVSRKMKDYLWVPEKKAYFYRNRENNLVNSLAHNNIRCMYFGTMSQSMADDFIRYHLLNPDEFWTPMPLTSIAANDPYFRNIKNNNWSGQPQGLTYQRAIRAIENYGHYAEVSLIGKKLLGKVSKTLLFTQQFDPYTSEQNGSDNYGPTILSVLEYFSRMYGVYLENDEVHFNGLPLKENYSYSQRMGNDVYKTTQENTIIKGYLNDIEIFACTAGVSVVTGLKGEFVRVNGIDSLARQVTLVIKGITHKGEVLPNGSYVLRDSKLVLDKKVPFDYPYKKPDFPVGPKVAVPAGKTVELKL